MSLTRNEKLCVVLAALIVLVGVGTMLWRALNG